ncbi:MAG: hypothetical protein AAFX01_00810 [Cyanobacteria bacterium J06638_28]
MISAALADGTTAGTTISNTATATYTDPTDQILTTESNTVTVTVAEVAGITVTTTDVRERPDANSDADGILEPDEQVQFVYDITNVGNDLTDFSLPAAATPAGPVSNIDTFEYLPVGADPNVDGNWIPFTSRTVVPNIEPGEIIKVRVTATVSTNAEADDIITMTYGDTPGNAQNQSYDNSGGSVFTADTDNDDTITDPNDPDFGEANTSESPRNGEREAASVGEIGINQTPVEQPLVQLSKTGGTAVDPDPGNNSVLDNRITYDFEFSVLDSDPTNSGVTPADLQPITLDVTGVGTTSDRFVLVSDAVPEGTVVDHTNLPTATGAASGWTVVYSSTPVTTNALEATWTATAPTDATEAAAITRVGFVSPTNAVYTVDGSSDAANNIFDGTSPISGFSMTVVTSEVDPNANPITIANIAQVFGSGNVDDPFTPEDETLDFPVMDESGDQTPSNHNPTDETFSNFNPNALDTSGPDDPHSGFNPPDGFIDDPSDLGNTGTDTNQNNTGTGDDGEAIVTILVSETPSDLLNGPDSEPHAVGPTSTNDDFTNKSTPFVEGDDPPVVPFTNTLDNDSSEAGWVKLEPQPPSDFLPTDTTATILANVNGTPISATYEYDGTDWNLISGSEVYVPIGADNGDPANDSNGGDDEISYGVEIDLPPDGSTDPLNNDPDNIKPLTGYPVPIKADLVLLSSLTDPAAPTQAEMNNPANVVATNTTIDRVYTGFLELLKSVEVLQGEGPPVVGAPAPGNVIRYRVSYQNISEQETGSMDGNVTLFAQNLEILEDGTERACDYDTLLGANNWALDNDDGTDYEVGTIDTSHVTGGVDLTGAEVGSLVTFFSGGSVCSGGVTSFNPTGATSTGEQSGTSVDTDVTKYLFEIAGDVQPGESGFIEFDRILN